MPAKYFNKKINPPIAVAFGRVEVVGRRINRRGIAVV